GAAKETIKNTSPAPLCRLALFTRSRLALFSRSVPRMAGDFKMKYAAGVTVRKKNVKPGEQARAHKRRPETLDSQLRMLKAAFSGFCKLGLAEANPFEKVELPELDRHEVKYVRPEDVGEFFGWLEKRYPSWSMPRLFFSAKAITGCRLEDLCSLGADQLQDG